MRHLQVLVPAVIVLFLAAFGFYALWAWAASAPADPTGAWWGDMARVVDGDTLDVQNRAGKATRCRLVGIDAPERPAGRNPGQPLAEEASKELARQAAKGPVLVVTFGQDRYGRALCLLWRPDGLSINGMMVVLGLAWAYPFPGSPFEAGFARYQEEAQRNGDGIWKLPGRESPADYRKRVRMKG